ncbi:MAG: hypothetical protein PVJ57_10865 [Phycisphaerae bacterium]
MAIAVLLLSHFGRYAYLRLTVEPPLSEQAAFADATDPGPPEPDDVTAELGQLVLTLTEQVPFDLPSVPAGMKWQWHRQETPEYLAVGDITRGWWKPVDRPHLRAVIAHLGDNLTRERLAALHALSGRPWQYDFFRSDEPRYAGLEMWKRYSAIVLLAADARYQHAERGDLAAAWQDLKTAIWLSQPDEPESALGVILQLSHARLFLSELQQMSREHAPDKALVAEIDAALRAWSPLRETWRAAVIHEEAMIQRTIDTCFTRDQHGQGWYVVSRQQNRLLAVIPRSFAQHPLWNLASACYSDRRTVEAKRARYFDALRQLVDLTYADARTSIDRLGLRDGPFCSVDGAVLKGLCTPALVQAYCQLLATHAEIDATRLALALGRCRSERGKYPESLAELVPAYMSALPLDPFGDAPFLYRRYGEAYVLYSRGPDGDDDGGAAPSPGGRRVDDCDLVYSGPRRDPMCEPRLVPMDGGPQ